MEKRLKALSLCVSMLLYFALMAAIFASTASAYSNQCEHGTCGFGYESGGFEKKDANGHNERVLCWYQCWICGYEWREYAWTEYKAHTFDSNGRCTACGYSKQNNESGSPSHSPEATLPPKDDSQVNPNTCKHTNKKTEKVGSVSKQYDDKCHETIVTYRDVCADCNAALSADRKDINRFDHQFDEDGACFCGYVQTKKQCDHKPIKTLKDTMYGKADINGHEVIKTYHYECKCKQVSYDNKETSVSTHDYNRNTCRLCGFEKECEHPDFEYVVSTAVEKNPNSASTHIIVTTYAEKCFCGATNPNPVKRSTAACRFTVHAGVNDLHEEQGHQYVVKCECGNEKANGKYKAYVSGCVVCGQLYNNCVLSRGNASNIPEKVKELQELLMRSGYDLPYYGADGDFSRETENAVKKFQKDHGLPVTGIVDEATWNALKNTLNYTDTLSKGNPSNKSHVVKELQELLIENGYDLPYYGADGDFSRETEKAVKKFQKDHGLPETGVVDEATWAMLRNPDGTFETGAPSHGPMEGLTDDKPSHSPAETLPPKAESDSETGEEPEHGPLEDIETDSPSHSPEATLPPKVDSDSETREEPDYGSLEEVDHSVNKLSNATLQNPNPNKANYYSNEFILFEHDASVREGYIRFVSQISAYTMSNKTTDTPTVFDADQWRYGSFDRSSEAGGLCSYAALSMQLSYLGIDCTPGKMFMILNGNGFNRQKIIDYLVEKEGADIAAVKKGLSDNSLTYDELDQMISSYEDNLNYSPVFMFMEYGENWQKTHALLIIGRDDGTYYLANPETHTGMGSFEIEVRDGIMYIKNASTTKYNGRRISTIAQTWINQ